MAKLIKREREMIMELIQFRLGTLESDPESASGELEEQGPAALKRMMHLVNEIGWTNGFSQIERSWIMEELEALEQRIQDRINDKRPGAWKNWNELTNVQILKSKF